MKRSRHIITVALIGLAMLAQLMSPTRAYADGETTPPPVETLTETPTPEPTEMPTETPTESPTEATPEPAATDEAPYEVAATVEPVETSTPEPAAEATAEPTEPADSTSESSGTALVETTATETEQPPLAEMMQALPENTSVVVLDESSEVLPLASQETSDVIAQADPIWCPDGVTPVPFTSGCTGSYSTMEELLAFEGGYINSQITGGTIWITEGSVPDVSPITIDGAIFPNWASNSLTLQGGWTGSGTSIGANSVFTVPLGIYNWSNNLTVDNITVQDANAAGWYAVVLQQNVPATTTITDSSITGSTGNGLNIQNFGNVEIDNTNVSGNQGTGADIGWNDVQIRNSHFDNNAYPFDPNVPSKGLHISANQAVTIENTTAIGNGWMGIAVDNSATITLNNVIANGNGWMNPDSSTKGNGALLFSYGNVFVNGTNSFIGNGWTALEISTSGAITLNNVTATDNSQWGAYLNTTDNITLNGTHDYSRNAAGILASTPAGAITLHNVTANNNWYSYGAQIIGGSSVTLAGINTFDMNGWTGLEIQNSGNIALNNITAKDNWGHGISVSNASGDISLSNITATANANTYGDGAYLENVAGAGNVTLTGINDFSNHNPWNSGMFILSNGNVSLNNLTSNNSGRGVNISRAANVTVTNATFENNGWEGGFDGLFIQQAGDVTLNNVRATNNNHGVQVFETSSVSIKGGAFESNGIGLYVICVASLNFNLPLATFTLNLKDVEIDPTCPVDVKTETEPVIFTTVDVQVEGEQFVLDCAKARSRFVVHLANGDRGDINCPVVGNATITRVDNTTLPANLPAGYTYASGFEFGIQKDGEDVIVISEGGYITASFIAASGQLQPGNSYAILYWDPVGSSWVPLKDYLLNEYRNTQVFDLFPGVTEDTRKILSGVKYFTEAGEERAEVSTNFPGIFVLAQH